MYGLTSDGLVNSCTVRFIACGKGGYIMYTSITYTETNDNEPLNKGHTAVKNRLVK